MRPVRRRHAGQRGDLILVGLIASFGVLLLGGFYAATHTDLSAPGSTAAAQVDTTIPGTYPCSGPEIQAFARDTLHLTMTSSGFRSSDSPEPQRSTFGADGDADADRRYGAAIAQWRGATIAAVEGAQQAMSERCKELAQQSALPATAKPTDEPALAINGTYTVDPARIAAVGGCGTSQAKGAPATLTVTWNGVSTTPPVVTVTDAGGTPTVFDKGPTFSLSGYHLDYTSQVSTDTQATLNGNFYQTGDRIEFTGEYATVSGPGGCGYTFIATKG